MKTVEGTSTYLVRQAMPWEEAYRLMEEALASSGPAGYRSPPALRESPGGPRSFLHGDRVCCMGVGSQGALVDEGQRRGAPETSLHRTI